MGRGGGTTLSCNGSSKGSTSENWIKLEQRNTIKLAIRLNTTVLPIYTRILKQTTPSIFFFFPATSPVYSWAPITPGYLTRTDMNIDELKMIGPLFALTTKQHSCYMKIMQLDGEWHLHARGATSCRCGGRHADFSGLKSGWRFNVPQI